MRTPLELHLGLLALGLVACGGEDGGGAAASPPASGGMPPNVFLPSGGTAGMGSGGGGAGGVAPGAGGDPAPPHVGENVQAAFPQSVSSAQDHTCWLDAAGSIQCEGSPFSDWTDPPPGSFVRITVANEHGCVIDASARITCWGQGEETADDCATNGFQDQCGQADPPEGEFIDVAVGEEFTCGVTTRAELVCWGKPPSGQGRIVGNFKQVTAGARRMCALTTAGEARCWDGGEERSQPVGSGLVEIATASGFACGLDAAGVVACGGSSQPDPASRFLRISARGNHACGIRVDGSMECWGSSNAHRIPPPPGAMTEIAAGWSHTCARFEDDVVRCWGREFGDGGGVFQCAVGEAELAGTVGGSALDGTYDLSWMDDRNTASYYEFLMMLGDGIALMRGNEPGLSGYYMPHFSGYDVVPFDTVLLNLGVTDSSAGELYCAGVGSTVTRSGDEGLLSLANVVALGPCSAGAPATGSVTFCYDSNGTGCDTVTGTVDGQSVDGPADFRGNVGAVHFRSGEGQYLLHTGPEASLAGAVTWGVFLTDPAGPHGGATYCAGAGSGFTVVERGTFDRTVTYTFSNLRRLPSCTGVTSTESLSGCIR